MPFSRIIVTPCPTGHGMRSRCLPWGRLLQPQNGIEYVASAAMRPRSAQVVEGSPIVHPGFLQGVGQDRQTSDVQLARRQRALLVDDPGQLHRSTIVVGEGGGADSERRQPGAAEDTAQAMDLGGPLLGL